MRFALDYLNSYLCIMQLTPTVLRSPYSDPPWNIALEEALRNYAKQGSGFFLLYINERSVIVGRNQDCSMELSEAALRERVPVFRRTTGGGAVYHDQGNLNWSFIVPGDLSLRPRLLSIVIGALEGLGVHAREGERGGLYADGRKVGGTASAAGGGALVYHGTLLVDSDLEALARYLSAHGREGYGQAADTETKSKPRVLSVGSEVGRLSDMSPGLGMAAVKDALLRAVADAADAATRPPAAALDSGRMLCPADLAMAAAHFSHHDWIYGRKSSPSLQREHEAPLADLSSGAGKGKT
jgi:lipoate-protein ligase A